MSTGTLRGFLEAVNRKLLVCDAGPISRFARNCTVPLGEAAAIYFDWDFFRVDVTHHDASGSICCRREGVARFNRRGAARMRSVTVNPITRCGECVTDTHTEAAEAILNHMTSLISTD